jgi:photosystem II stability/assembly factor-like uncharacterized protein
MLKPRHWHTLVLELICSTSQAGTNSWTSTGPEGGPVASVAFHPTDDTALLAGSARGVHLSLTTGAFWARMFEGDINDIGTVVFDPSREGRVFALGNSLYRSDDDARTFARAYPFGNVMSMALAKDGVLYLLDMDGRVFRSADAGGQWTQLVVPWANSWPGNISVDPAHSNVVYAAYRGVGLYRSLDSGATWQPPLASGPGTRNDFDMAIRVVVDPTDSDRLLAATYDGLMHSEDGGANWATRLPGWQIAWVGFDPMDPASAVAMDRYGQIFRSPDGGATWPTNLRPPRLPVLESYSLALSPLHAGRMLAATSEGPMYSEDGGATFQRKVTNLATGTAASLSSADDGTVYAAMRFPSGIFTRSGTSWYPVNNAPLLDTRARCVAVAAGGCLAAELLQGLCRRHGPALHAFR